ncbi:MAG: winged helix-turn-helix domain-containing protein [Halobacteria archaeon]|nr:winged helix-turn-helix domain-containing protein [Halobacteria archaeon]
MENTDESDPSNLLKVLTDETRVGILEALADAQRESPEDPHLSFSELRERVGTRDSGKFNYHLKRLRGSFIEKTDDGYGLTYTGRRIISSILAGTYDEPEETEAELDYDCTVCGEPLSMVYEEGVMEIKCENDHTVQNFVSPGGVEDRTVDEILELMSLTTYHDLQLVHEGICPMCHGKMGIDVKETEEWNLGYFVSATCTRCGMHSSTSLGSLVANHPAVVSFFYEHDVDVRKMPPWTLDFLTDTRATVESHDPFRAVIKIEKDGSVLELTVDSDLDVVGVERVERD